MSGRIEVKATPGMEKNWGTGLHEDTLKATCDHCNTVTTLYCDSGAYTNTCKHFVEIDGDAFVYTECVHGDKSCWEDNDQLCGERESDKAQDGPDDIDYDAVTFSETLEAARDQRERGTY